jgi:hypothetical protein
MTPPRAVEEGAMFPTFADLAPLVVLMVPIASVTMVFVAIILRMIFRQRAIERVMRARIEAVERGVDPSRLPTAV